MKGKHGLPDSADPGVQMLAVTEFISLVALYFARKWLARVFLKDPEVENIFVIFL